jgi:hypothetical protein
MKASWSGIKYMVGMFLMETKPSLASCFQKLSLTKLELPKITCQNIWAESMMISLSPNQQLVLNHNISFSA